MGEENNILSRTKIDKLDGDTADDKIESLLNHHNHTQEEWEEVKRVFRKDFDDLTKMIETFQKKVESYILEVNGKLKDHDQNIENLNDKLKVQKIYGKTTQSQVMQLQENQRQLSNQVNENYKLIDSKLETNRTERREDIGKLSETINGFQKEIQDGFAGLRKDEETSAQNITQAKNDNLNKWLKIIGTIIAMGGLIFIAWGFFR